MPVKDHSPCVLAKLNQQRGGFFIDSGAAEGIQGNNTYVLETQFGWTGICVEPTPEFFDSLRQVRRCHLVNGALSDQDGEATLVIPAGNPWLSGLEHKLGQDIWAVTRAGAGRKITVPTFRIGTLLAQFQAPKIIDYWSLDTEGSEYEILQTFPWDTYHVTVLTIEHNCTPTTPLIAEFMAKLGYEQFRLEENPDNEFGFVKWPCAPSAC